MKFKSRVSECIYETAKNLYDAGMLTDEQMQYYTEVTLQEGEKEMADTKKKKGKEKKDPGKQPSDTKGGKTVEKKKKKK